MKICAVYKVRNKVTDWAYIGSSVDCLRRWFCHRGDLRKGTHSTIRLQRPWNKHGEENFEFIILEMCEYKDLVIREQWYIDNTEKKYNTARAATPGPYVPRTVGSRNEENNKAK